MIIIVGGDLDLKEKLPDCTAKLVNYHVQITQARFANELQTRFTEGTVGQLSHLSGSMTLANYQAAIRNCDTNHEGAWFIRDDRPILFWQEFIKQVDRAGLVWVKPDNEAEIPDPVQAQIKVVYTAYKGPKMIVTKQTAAEIKKVIALATKGE